MSNVTKRGYSESENIHEHQNNKMLEKGEQPWIHI